MRANVEMAGKIAKMHKDNIQSGFLSSLGVVFLTMLYTFLIKFFIGLMRIFFLSKLLPISYSYFYTSFFPAITSLKT